MRREILHFFCAAALFTVTACGGSEGGASATTAGLDDVLADSDVASDDTVQSSQDTSEPADVATPQDLIDGDDVLDVQADEDATAPEVSQDSNEGPEVEQELVELPDPPPSIDEGVMFRVNWVNVIEPGFCIKPMDDPNGDCADISGVINAYVGSHLQAGQNPLDVIGFFDPFTFSGELVQMSFGGGSCKRLADGTIEWCDFYKLPTFFEDTKMAGPGQCTQFSDGAACYTTTKADMSLDLAGVPLGFEEAFTAGTFEFDDLEAPTGIAYAYVQGFMTQEAAEATEVDLTLLDAPVKLSDLLDWSYLEVKDGVSGWYFKVEYAAEVVPPKP
ncbi:MAG TPA: hypothetical protein EYN66_04045 [Myxococcales bacterium]|nr:hypothetical protein [Myxococcales bacterium]